MKKTKPELPNPRPCLECHETRPIAARGLCERCRSRARRENLKPFTPASAVSQGKAARNFAQLISILEDCKVSSKSVTVILREFLPYSGQPQVVIEAYTRAIREREEANKLEEQ